MTLNSFISSFYQFYYSFQSEQSINEAFQNSLYQNNLNDAEFYLSVGADINAQLGRFGDTMLWSAIRRDETNQIKWLLENGANPNAMTLTSYGNKPELIEKEAPLQYAAAYSKNDIAKMLIEHGADLNSLTTVNSSPLVYAAGRNNVELVKLLLDAGADTQTFKENSCEFGHYDFMPASELKTQVHLQHDASHSSALYNAIYSKNVEIINILLNAGVDKNLGLTPLDLAVIEGNAEKTQQLLSEGFNVNTQNLLGTPSIDYAILNGDIDTIKLLADFGADLNIGDGVYHAVFHNNLEVLETVVDLGADVNKLLQIAVGIVHLDAVDLLLAHGADPHYKNEAGECSFTYVNKKMEFAERNNDPSYTAVLEQLQQKLLAADSAKEAAINIEDVISTSTQNDDVISANVSPNALVQAQLEAPAPAAIQINNDQLVIMPVIIEM